MTNKILDHIEAMILEGQDRCKPEGISFERAYHRDDALHFADRQTRVRFKLEVFFEQYVDVTTMPEHRALVNERAKVAIARHLYDDVVRDLCRVQDAMWQNGDQKTPAMDKLNAMIRELSGEMTRF